MYFVTPQYYAYLALESSEALLKTNYCPYPTAYNYAPFSSLRTKSYKRYLHQYINKESIIHKYAENRELTEEEFFWGDSTLFWLEHYQGNVHIWGMCKDVRDIRCAVYQKKDFGVAANDIFEQSAIPIGCFDSFKAANPKIKDIVVSPKQSTILLIMDNEIQCFDVFRRKCVWTKAISGTNLRVVSIEWISKR